LTCGPRDEVAQRLTALIEPWGKVLEPTGGCQTVLTNVMRRSSSFELWLISAVMVRASIEDSIEWLCARQVLVVSGNKPSLTVTNVIGRRAWETCEAIEGNEVFLTSA
jgi:hypothetical protein